MSYSSWKRWGDIIGAILLLLVTLPLWGIIACLLLITQGRPVLFRQLRVGVQGTTFTLLKFRTMTPGVPPRYPDIPVGKHPADPRITPVGQLIRRLSLDELPQLLNVLRGEMSLVGPRPLPQEDLAQPEWLTDVAPEERTRRETWATRRHDVLPGLTGLWQISHCPVEDFDNWLKCDLAYTARVTFWGDLRILLLTPWAVLRGRPKGVPATTPAPVCRQSSEDPL